MIRVPLSNWTDMGSWWKIPLVEGRMVGIEKDELEEWLAGPCVSDILLVPKEDRNKETIDSTALRMLQKLDRIIELLEFLKELKNGS